MPPACCHVQGVKVAQKGNMQAVGALLRHSRPHPPVLIAQHEQGGKFQRRGKGVHAVFREARGIGGESRLAGLLHGAGQIDHLGQRQAFQRSGGGTAGSGAEIGAVVSGQNQPRSAQSVQGAGQRAHVAWVLHLIQRHDKRQGSIGGFRQQGFPRHAGG